MGLSLDEIDPPLDDVTFLSRSNNRVAVLSELQDAGRTRRELREAIGVSRPTLGRILEGFEERGWIANEDREYELTPLGRLLVEEFTDLMDTVEATQKLRDLAPMLPTDEMDFDLGALADATITTPSRGDVTAHSRRESELLERSERVRFLCNQAQPETVGRYRDWIVAEAGEFEAIICGDAIDAARADPEMDSYLRDMVATETASIYRYEGSLSVMLGLYDETATVVPLDDAGIPRALIECDEESVMAWVGDTIDAHRRRADEVTIESFSQ